jgi:hypothetical protein
MPHKRTASREPKAIEIQETDVLLDAQKHDPKRGAVGSNTKTGCG